MRTLTERQKSESRTVYMCWFLCKLSCADNVSKSAEFNEMCKNRIILFVYVVQLVLCWPHIQHKYVSPEFCVYPGESIEFHKSDEILVVSTIFRPSLSFYVSHILHAFNSARRTR